MKKRTSCLGADAFQVPSGRRASPTTSGLRAVEGCGDQVWALIDECITKIRLGRAEHSNDTVPYRCYIEPKREDGELHTATSQGQRLVESELAAVSWIDCSKRKLAFTAGSS